MTKQVKSERLERVRAFWNVEACGTHFVQGAEDERDFYERYRNFRYQTEWHIPRLVPFAQMQGKRILEIGCGNGADGVQFASHGADYTGVDLTEAAVSATRRHFEVLGLSGRFQVENAEALSLGDAAFDVVYSHGVLHHTPNIDRAIQEVHRVLKPGGQAIIMLYHKQSFNYHVRIMGYMRLRVLMKILFRWGRWESDRAALGQTASSPSRGNLGPDTWEVHYRNFLREGREYLKATKFIHHCTDGPECPCAHAFSKCEARQLFSRFATVEMKVAHFPLRKYRWARWVPLSVEQFLASHWGWYLFIFSRK